MNPIRAWFRDYGGPRESCWIVAIFPREEADPLAVIVMSDGKMQEISLEFLTVHNDWLAQRKSEEEK